MDPGSSGEVGLRANALGGGKPIDRRGVLRVVGFVGIASLGSCLESWDNFQRDVEDLDLDDDVDGTAMVLDDRPARRVGGRDARPSETGGDDAPETQVAAGEKTGT